MMKKFDIKEKLCAFLLKEDGKISKKNVLKAGIVLGAIALAGKAVRGANPEFNGDCPNVNASLMPCDGANAGCDANHANAAHANNLNVKNMFGKLVLGHSNCIETAKTHGQYVPPWGESGGGDSCCSNQVGTHW